MASCKRPVPSRRATQARFCLKCLPALNHKTHMPAMTSELNPKPLKPSSSGTFWWAPHYRLTHPFCGSRVPGIPIHKGSPTSVGVQGLGFGV